MRPRGGVANVAAFFIGQFGNGTKTVLSFQSDLFAFAIEGGLINAQLLRRFGQAGCALQDATDVKFLKFLQGDCRTDFGERAGASGCSNAIAQFTGQVGGNNLVLTS